MCGAPAAWQRAPPSVPYNVLLSSPVFVVTVYSIMQPHGDDGEAGAGRRTEVGVAQRRWLALYIESRRESKLRRPRFRRSCQLHSSSAYIG